MESTGKGTVKEDSMTLLASPKSPRNDRACPEQDNGGQETQHNSFMLIVLQKYPTQLTVPQVDSTGKGFGEGGPSWLFLKSPLRPPQRSRMLLWEQVSLKWQSDPRK